MELGIVLTVCLFIFSLIIYLIRNYYKDEISSLKSTSRVLQDSIYNSHFAYLRVLRREYANNILNPETLLNLDRKAYMYEKEVEEMSVSDFNIEIASFWKKYPDIQDFDVHRDTPHFVKYMDIDMEFFSMDEYDISESYLNIVKYMALLHRQKSGGSSIDTGTNIELLKETQRDYDSPKSS